MFKILSEDKQMVELLEPERVAAEVSLEADLPQIMFRKLRQVGWCCNGVVAFDCIAACARGTKSALAACRSGQTWGTWWMPRPRSALMARWTCEECLPGGVEAGAPGDATTSCTCV